MRSPCVRCGNLLHTGEGKVIVSFSLDELVDLAFQTIDPIVRRRLICAIGLLDEERENKISNEIANLSSDT
jgi:hypothetical protein